MGINRRMSTKGENVIMGMTMATVLASMPTILRTLSYEELVMVRKYEMSEEEREEEELWYMYDLYDDFDSYMYHTDPCEQVRVRDRHLAAVKSDIGYDRGVRYRSKGAGSGIAFMKRRVRRTERRVGKEIIREQVYS